MVLESPIVTMIEVIYVVYILNYFKTRYSLAHPFTYFENKLLYHPIGTSDTPICNICPLGNIGAYFIACFVIIRFSLLNSSYSNRVNIRFASIFVLCIVFMISLMNFNAVVYMLPYFVLEILFIQNL